MSRHLVNELRNLRPSLDRRERTLALDAVHQLSFVNVIGQLVRRVMVAMGTDRAVQLQRVCVEPTT